MSVMAILQQLGIYAHSRTAFDGNVAGGKVRLMDDPEKPLRRLWSGRAVLPQKIRDGTGLSKVMSLTANSINNHRQSHINR